MRIGTGHVTNSSSAFCILMRLYVTKLVALLLPFKEALQEQVSYAYISDEKIKKDGNVFESTTETKLIDF